MAELREEMRMKPYMGAGCLQRMTEEVLAESMENRRGWLKEKGRRFPHRKALEGRSRYVQLGQRHLRGTSKQRRKENLHSIINYSLLCIYIYMYDFEIGQLDTSWISEFQLTYNAHN